MEKFYKSAVLCGEVDYHCLLCDETFTHEESAERHIRWEMHRKKLKANQYVHKYKSHLISKIKKLFYCEPCNITLSSIKDVPCHVADETHINNKRMYISGELPKKEKNIIRFHDSVILYDELLIEEKPWNGIVGKSCLLCEETIEDYVEIHLLESNHVLNLIRSRIQKENGTTVFRKISDATFQCMTCNKVLPQSTFTTHWADTEHQSMYENCKINNQPKNKENITIKTIVNFESQCVVANTKEEKTFEPKSFEMDTTDEDLNKAMGTKNYIFSKLFSTECLLCNWHIPKSSVNDHVKGEHHRTVLKTEMELRKIKNAENAKANNNNNVKAETDGEEKVEEVPLDEQFKCNLKKMFASPAAEKTEALPNMDDILQRLDEFQKEGIKINLETRYATCTKCNFELQLNANAMANHIRFHKKILESPDFQTRKENDTSEDAENVENAQSLPIDPEQYAKENGLIYNKVKSTCNVCDTFVVGQLKCLQQHIKGNRHQTLLKVYTKNELPPKEPNADYKSIELKSFVKHISLVTDRELFVINHTMCVNHYSYALLKMLKDREWMKCYACYEEFPFSYRHDHCDNEKHQNVVDSSQLIVSLENEFVREIRPNLYHCGYCNELHPGWTNLKRHLNNLKHLQKKMEIMQANQFNKMIQDTENDSSDDDDDDDDYNDWMNSDDSDDEPNLLRLLMLLAMRG